MKEKLRYQSSQGMNLNNDLLGALHWPRALAKPAASPKWKC